MKKIAWVGIGLIILIVISLGFYWFSNVRNIRNKVLSHLEQKLEFCSILKENVNGFSNTGEFWLVCNNRPFYTTYENDNVNYELNGWGFLKEDPGLWNELSSCNFYNSEKIGDNYSLFFYCKEPDKINVKIYSFDANSVKMTKVEEKNFLDIFADDVRSLYNFLSECKVVNSSQVLPNIWLKFDCNGVIYSAVYSEEGVLPVMVNDSSYEEIVKASFEKSTGLKVNNISYSDGNILSFHVLSAPTFNESIKVEYTFTDLPQTMVNIECSEGLMDNCVSKYIKYLSFPPIKGTKEIKFLEERKSSPFNILVYKINRRVVLISVYKEDNVNRMFKAKVKDEGMSP
jgi:hypothetical protein